AAVIRIADQRAADGLHMDANLVHSTGFNNHFEQSIPAESLPNVDDAPRLPAAVVIDSSQARKLGMPSDGKINGQRRYVGCATNERRIHLSRLTIAELAHQIPKGFLILRHD